MRHPGDAVVPRFFVPDLSGETVVLMGEEGRHIAKSLRCRVGETLTLCDGRGLDAQGVIAAVEGETVTLRIAARTPSRGELPCRVTLYQALPKGDKLEFIVQKAVELGAFAIVPVLTSRCISRPDKKGAEKKRERLQKIAREAAGQSGRGRIPEVRPLLSFGEALGEMGESPCPILFYEEARELLGPLLAPRPGEIALMVGSEGGFSPEEAEKARERGIRLCTMGPRILRCETAPLYALSAIGYAYENLEPPRRERPL